MAMLILNSLSTARDGTHIFMDTSQVHFLLSHSRNSEVSNVLLWLKVIIVGPEVMKTVNSWVFGFTGSFWWL